MTHRRGKSKQRVRSISPKRRSNASQPLSAPRHRSSTFTARLTMDVTPDLRGRIKITAFERGVTVAYMLRTLLLKAFPRTKGGRQ